MPVTTLPEERMQFTLGFYGDGDFYTMSEIDARLRELRRDEDFDRKHSN